MKVLNKKTPAAARAGIENAAATSCQSHNSGTDPQSKITSSDFTLVKPAPRNGRQRRSEFGLFLIDPVIVADLRSNLQQD
jgi:hypothetical protein